MIGETTFFSGLPTRELKTNEVETVAPQSPDRSGVVGIDICSANLSQALEHSDESLLKRIQEGGKEALALFVPALRRFCAQRCKPDTSK